MLYICSHQVEAQDLQFIQCEIMVEKKITSTAKKLVIGV